MFTINIYLKFALIALFLGGGILLAFLYGFWYALIVILIGIGLLASYLLLGTVQSSAEMIQTMDMDGAEKRLNLTFFPNLLYVSNRAFYYIMRGTIAINRNQTNEAEALFNKALTLNLPTDTEKGMVLLQLANINAQKNPLTNNILAIGIPFCFMVGVLLFILKLCDVDYGIITEIFFYVRNGLFVIGGIIVFSIFYKMRRNKLAMYITIGTTILLIVGGISTFIGFVENDFRKEADGYPMSLYKFVYIPITYSQIGILIEIVFFSMGLSYRTKHNILEAEKKNQSVSKQLADTKLNVITKEKEQAIFQQQIAETELIALKAQFNPHFVANALNSIKSLVQQKKEEEAIAYLSTFSELVRSVLDYSEETLISIEKELIFCRLYLDIESLRFDKSFNYQIIIQNQIDVSYIKIPPLLLQPILENALWHGLQLKKGKKELTIKILEEKENQVVKCEIRR